MADLYIRWSNASPKDLGDRPITPCWPPNAVWTNASIWMSYPPNHPDPAKANQTAPVARVGEEVLVNVRAYTRGAQFQWPSMELTTPIRCQVWACTGANGVGPVSALASSGGANGLEGLVHGLLDVPDWYGIASVAWTPSAADGLVFDAQGAAHICLAANLVYAATPGSSPSPQGQRLPQFVPGGPQVTTVFPCGDGPVDPRSGVPIGHFQGQKNIQVLDASAGSSLSAELQVYALDDQAGMHLLQLVERRGRGGVDGVLAEHLLALPSVELVGGRPRRQRTAKLTPELREMLAKELGPELVGAGPLAVEPAERARLAGGGTLVLAADTEIRLQPARGPLEAAAMEGPTGERAATIEVATVPGEPARVVVDVRAAEEDPPGTVRVFDIAERDGKGRLVGGTTLVTLSGAA